MAMPDDDHPVASRRPPLGPGHGRMAAGVAWAALLLGLWLWGRDLTDGGALAKGPTTGDVAAVGRPLEQDLPAAHAPLATSPEGRPAEVAIGALGVRAGVVKTGLDATGAVDAPSYRTPGLVGWYAKGPQPGTAGAAVLVGHVDTADRRAVFHRLGSLKPGQPVDVHRADGGTARFTVEDVKIYDRRRFAPRKVYGAQVPGRAELRLITCAGAYDRERDAYTANVVVYAYLTKVTPVPEG
ncbi:class F sortase [Streptomyces rimosus]|uniref:class F sortase n=1 Tax=Streptomyces rimosus TaxID=1927 RepID=UPI000998172F|nr:class F sortase [Streptomyces rimosus]